MSRLRRCRKFSQRVGERVKLNPKKRFTLFEGDAVKYETWEGVENGLKLSLRPVGVLS